MSLEEYSPSLVDFPYEGGRNEEEGEEVSKTPPMPERSQSEEVLSLQAENHLDQRCSCFGVKYWVDGKKRKSALGTGLTESNGRSGLVRPYNPEPYGE